MRRKRYGLRMRRSYRPRTYRGRRLRSRRRWR
ncbi:hypothetical protein [Dipodfec virus UA23Rod_1392]|uniref:Uncharacterized protein n=1 Tax=Dipodfec virus UA23Rod_1392 TaxID=2929332 RepID=A0A976N2T1_9VIRU|nr:hypothetical protein [Dipodfec virus UA23Rod_1392]